MGHKADRIEFGKADPSRCHFNLHFHVMWTDDAPDMVSNGYGARVDR